MRKEIVVFAVIAVLVVAATYVGYLLAKDMFTKPDVVMLQADKETYTIGEEITFKLLSPNQGSGFVISGDKYDNLGVYVGKLPPDMTIDAFLNSSTNMVNSPLWYHDGPQVKFPQFNGRSGHLNLSWDGTFSSYNETSREYEDCLATSGYYFLAAKYSVTMGSYPELRTDRSSVFYLDSLDVEQDLSYSATNGSLTLDLTISSGASRATHGQLNCSVTYPKATELPTDTNESYFLMSTEYLNDTMSLAQDEWGGSTTVVPYPEGGFSYFEARLVTDEGTFTFGVMVQVAWDHIEYRIYR